MSTNPPFAELALAAYCPRKLYYRRRDDDEIPPAVARRRALAFEYADLLDASDAALESKPLAVSPGTFRRNLERAAGRDEAVWEALVDPAERDRLAEGKDCRGVVHKVLSLDAPTPSLVSPGDPPEAGVWKPQRVKAVAATKALSWEHERRVERAFVEYPAHGVVREVRATVRNKAAYRSALRTARSLDGPPPRLRDSAKCDSCEYRGECGVKTRSVRSLLG